MDDKRFAENGEIWVCGACGKTAKDRYGDGNSSWDESCFMNSILCKESSLVRHPNGMVVKADPVEDSK